MIRALRAFSRAVTRDDDGSSGSAVPPPPPVSRYNLRGRDHQRSSIAAVLHSSVVPPSLSTLAQSQLQGAPPAPPGQALSENEARRADVYAVGKLVAARAQRERQGRPVHSQAMAEVDGIPVKEALQVQFRLTRDKTIWDATFFLLHFGLLLAFSLSFFDVHSAFVANNALSNTVANRELPNIYWLKTFMALANQDDISAWLNPPASDPSSVGAPFLSALFATAAYNGQSLGEAELPYVLGGNYRLLGPIELRLVRVAAGSCQGIAGLPGPGLRCYGPWSLSQQFLGTVTGPVSGAVYDYGAAHASELRGLWGSQALMQAASFGTRGLSVLLPPGDAAAATGVLGNLTADGLFRDQALRAVGITVNLYNTNAQSVSACRFTLEVLETNDLVPNAVCFTTPVPELFLTNDADRAVLLALALYIFGVLYYARREARRLFWGAKGDVRAYLAEPAAASETALLLVNAVFLGYLCTYLVAAVGTTVDVNAPGLQAGLFDTGQSFANAFAWGGLACLLSALKLFRFLALNKRMSTLWLTLYRARNDLAAFGIVLSVCVMGFAFLGQQAFGSSVEPFKDFGSSVNNLLQFILGNFNYIQLTTARPLIAWLYFGLFIAVVNIAVINLIIAIVSKYFAEVHEELERVDKWKNPTPRLEQEAARWLRLQAAAAARAARLHCCCCASPRGARMLQQRRLCWCSIWAAAGRALWRSRCGVLLRCARRETAAATAAAAAAAAVAARGPRPAPVGIAGRAAVLRRDALEATGRALDEEGGAEAGLEGLDEAALDELLQRSQRAAEARFLGEMRRAMQLAKQRNRIELFSYCERLYEDTPGSDGLYLGVHELCCAVRVRPCMPSGHRDCEARRLVDAYAGVKLAAMVGRVQMHRPVRDVLGEAHRKAFAVQLVSHVGRRRAVRVVVDDERGQLLLFADGDGESGGGDALLRQLPLTQLVQAERNLAEGDALTLVFTSQGVPLEEETEAQAGQSLELALRLRFRSHARRVEFTGLVLAAQARLVAEYETIMADMRGGGGSSPPVGHTGGPG